MTNDFGLSKCYTCGGEEEGGGDDCRNLSSTGRLLLGCGL